MYKKYEKLVKLVKDKIKINKSVEASKQPEIPRTLKDFKDFYNKPWFGSRTQYDVLSYQYNKLSSYDQIYVDQLIDNLKNLLNSGTVTSEADIKFLKKILTGLQSNAPQDKQYEHDTGNKIIQHPYGYKRRKNVKMIKSIVTGNVGNSVRGY